MPDKAKASGEGGPSGRRELRVGIDARLPDGEGGGVASVVSGLAHGLSGLADGDEEYLFLVLENHDAWLRPYLSGPCRTLSQPGESETARSLGRLRGRIAQAAPITRAIWHRLPLRLTTVPRIPHSTGLAEVAGVDVIHFVSQSAFLTSIPSIYHPHDLQHLHLPQFFPPKVRAIRDRHYRAFADQATMVAVASTWTKRDVAARLGIPDSKILVVPWAPPLAAVPEPTPGEAMAVARRLRLPARFLLYPARTWPHKNHAVLIDALSLLRSRDGIDAALVFTGNPTPEAKALHARTRRLGVDDLVTWTGFLDPVGLRAVYALSEGVIIPSLFEAASAPLWEAWLAGKPAACSNVTSLPEQAGNAALVFDPTSVDAVADAIAKLWTASDLRNTLAQRGAQRVGAFTWDRTARTFRAHYRRIAGATVSPEDADLMAAEAGI